MVKYIISFALMILCYSITGQVNTSQNGTQYIAQFTYQENLSSQQIADIEQNLQQNSNIRMARVDRITNGVFILTNSLSQFNQSILNSWLGVNYQVIDCYREGIYRVDDVIPFDENFCDTND